MSNTFAASTLLAVTLTLAAVLSLAGCESYDTPATGAKAPVISGLDVHGEHVTLERLKGRIVVVYFWANSCCGESVKKLQPLYQRYRRDQLEILAVAELTAPEEVAAYARKNSLTFPILTDEGGSASRRYQVLGFPTIFILDRNGIVREKILGEPGAETLRNLVERQLRMPNAVDAHNQKLPPR